MQVFTRNFPSSSHAAKLPAHAPPSTSAAEEKIADEREIEAPLPDDRRGEAESAENVMAACSEGACVGEAKGEMEERMGSDAPHDEEEAETEGDGSADARESAVQEPAPEVTSFS
jgi:hypothetical protein